MLKVDRDILVRVRSSSISITELSQYLLSTFPVTEISMELARYILKQGAGEKVSVSVQQLADMFRITGFKMEEMDGEYCVEEKEGRYTTILRFMKAEKST